jgi:hypothetical protein
MNDADQVRDHPPHALPTVDARHSITEDSMMHRWLTCLGLGLLLTIAASPARALTLADVSVPGTQFSAGAFTFSNFHVDFSAEIFDFPPTPAAFHVIPLDSGGFSLSSFSVFSGSVPRELDLQLDFTVTGPQIGGFGVSSASISASAGDFTGNHAFATLRASKLGQSVGVGVVADEFDRTAHLSPAFDHTPVNPTDVMDFALFVSVGATAGGHPVPTGGFATASISDPTFIVNTTPEPSGSWLVAVLPALWLGRRWRARATR